MGAEFSQGEEELNARSAGAAFDALMQRLAALQEAHAQQTQLLQAVLAREHAGNNKSGRGRSGSGGGPGGAPDADFESWLHSADPYALTANSSTRSMSARSLTPGDDTSSTMSEDVHDFGEQDLEELLAPAVDASGDAGDAEEFTGVLHPDTDGFYIKKHPVTAFQIAGNASLTTTEEGWGTRTAGPGDWAIFNTEGDETSMYTVSHDFFEANYEACGGAPNMYRKRRALARCMPAAFYVDVLENGEVHRYAGAQGDWLLQAHEDGVEPSQESAQWVIEADKFAEIYSLASAVSSHTRMLEGVVGVADTSLRRRASQLSVGPGAASSEVLSMLEAGIDSWDFPIFEFNDLCNRQPLARLAVFLFERHDLALDLPLSSELVFNFFSAIEQTYLPNPYHNALHGADVCQATHHFMVSMPSFYEKLTTLERFVALVASACHDVGHPGTNNAFQVNASAKVAIRYNDVSVLENFHAATTFRISSSRESAIMRNFSLEDYREARASIIKIILATDLAKHKVHLVDFQERRLAADISLDEAADRLMLLEMCVKAADISHPSRNHDVHLKWTEACMQEFVDQGEKEKALGITVTMNVDKSAVGIASSQMGFIKFLVQPFFAEFCAYWNEYQYATNITANLHSWEACKAHGSLEKDFRLTRNIFKFATSSRQNALQGATGTVDDADAAANTSGAAMTKPHVPRTLSQTASMIARNRRQLDAL